MRVDVYFNRTRKCWSVRATNVGVVHARALVLIDCTMRVGETARRRVERTGKRCVHAYITGTRFADTPANDTEAAVGPWEEICYNPFRDETFKASGRPIFAAEAVRFDPDGRCFARSSHRACGKLKRRPAPTYHAIL